MITWPYCGAGAAGAGRVRRGFRAQQLTQGAGGEFLCRASGTCRSELWAQRRGSVEHLKAGTSAWSSLSA